MIGEEKRCRSYLHCSKGQAPAQAILDDAIQPAVFLTIRERHKVVFALYEFRLLDRKGIVVLDPVDECFGVA